MVVEFAMFYMNPTKLIFQDNHLASGLLKVRQKTIISFFLLAFFFVSFTRHGQAQFVEIGFNLAGTTYQGDISPLRYRFSFQGAKFAYGLNLGYHLNRNFSVRVSYNKGSIAASDKYAADAWRRERNLNFRTDIREWSLTSDIFFLEYSRFFRKYDLKPFVRVGIALFSFNPQGEYNRQWYDLQPLSTEGQGLPGSDAQPYKLTQLSIPFGFGLAYDLNQYFRVGFDVSPRITFTDYLDDVSRDYPDFALLEQEKGPMAVNLSYKGNLIPGGLSPDKLTTVGRGNSGDNDWYIFSSVSISVVFDPVVERIKRRTFNGARKCTF